MADDVMLALLQEIRDLQKQQLEHLQGSIANQKQSLANQQQSLAVQQQAVDRQKTLLSRTTRLCIFLLCVMFLLLSVSLFPFFFRLFLGHHPACSWSAIYATQPVGTSISRLSSRMLK